MDKDLHKKVMVYAVKTAKKIPSTTKEDIYQDLWLEVEQAKSQYDPTETRSFSSFVEKRLEWRCKDMIRLHWTAKACLEQYAVFEIEQADAVFENIVYEDIEKSIVDLISKKRTYKETSVTAETALTLFRLITDKEVIPSDCKRYTTKELSDPNLLNYLNLTQWSLYELKRYIDTAIRSVVFG
jgi:DNA-directed RNA polymerase specialized sigma24 family protein